MKHYSETPVHPKISVFWFQKSEWQLKLGWFSETVTIIQEPFLFLFFCRCLPGFHPIPASYSDRKWTEPQENEQLSQTTYLARDRDQYKLRLSAQWSLYIPHDMFWRSINEKWFRHIKVTDISKPLISLKTSRQRMETSQGVGWPWAEVQERKKWHFWAVLQYLKQSEKSLDRNMAASSNWHSTRYLHDLLVDIMCSWSVDGNLKMPLSFKVVLSYMTVSPN